MQARFTAFAGFLATATLLSGSAFAFAPTFNGDLPTVIITDKLEYPAGANGYDVNGVGAASTQDVFRFSDAFDLGAYVTLGSGNTASTVRYLFNEFANTDPIPASPNDRAVGTLLLDGNRAFATGATQIPAAADFASAPTIASAASLDFRNRDFSGDDANVNSGFDAIGDVTGYNLTLSGPQERLVQLYIKADANAGIDVATFLVVTSTAGDGDELTSAVLSDPFVKIYPASGSGLVGWATGAQGQFYLLPTPGDSYDIRGTAGAIGGYSYTTTPTQTVAFNSATRTAAGTTQLTLSGTSAQLGYATLSLPFGESTISLAADKLYRLRANIYSPNTASKEQLRVSFGDQYRAGLFTVNYSDTSNAAFVNGPPTLGSATNNVLEVYGLSKGASPSCSIVVDIVTLGSTLSGSPTGQEITINSVEIGEANPSDLGTGTVILNLGGTVATPLAGEIRTVAASPTAFNTTVNDATKFSAAQFNTNQPYTQSLTGSAATFTFSTRNPNPPDFTNFGNAGSSVDATAPGLFTVSAGKIYVADIWVSSSTAGNIYPDLRSSVSVAASFNAFSTHIVEKVLPAFLGGTASPLAINTAPRAYSVVFKPQIATATAPANVSIVLLSLGKTYATNATLTISRITVTEYNDPAN